MLDLYWAVRRAIYNKSKSGFAFSQGMGPYSPSLCEAFVKFERQNRGHRKLLSYSELSVFATESRFNLYNPLNAVTIRNRLGHVAYALFNEVVHARMLPATPEMQDVLGARDARGYIAFFSQAALREFIETVGFTAKVSFDLENLRLEHGVNSATPHTLHLLLNVKGLKLRRAVSLSPGSFHTLGGARALLAEARGLLENLLDDISDWPELQPKAPALVDAATGSMSSAAESSSNVIIGPHTRQRLLEAREATERMEPPVDSANAEELCEVAVDCEESSRQIEADAALVRRLQHDLKGFLSAYTPETRAFLASHWDQMREVVPVRTTTS